MSEQLSLMGLEARPTDRLFFGAFAPSTVAPSIQRVQQELALKYRLHGKPLPPDRLHITLCHLGDYAGLPNDLVQKALAAGADLSGGGVDVSFDTVGSFAGRARNRPVVLRGAEGVAGVIALQERLHVAMRGAGLAKWAKPYTPHVTLLYDNTEIPEQAIEPIGWRLNQIILVHSELGKTRHNVLGAWALPG